MLYQAPPAACQRLRDGPGRMARLAYTASCMLCIVGWCALQSVHEVLAVVCAGNVLEGWHVFPLPLDTHKDWPSLQRGFEQLPGCGAEALDNPAFYRCAGQQT